MLHILGEKDWSLDKDYSPDMPTDGEFAGGTGTATDPYLISTPAQLDNVRKNLSAHYKLIKDIDLANWGDWEPISPFIGSFDGDGHVIKNMTIDTAVLWYAYDGGFSSAGLFGYVGGGTSYPYISNIGIVNSKVNIITRNTGSVYAGGIAGYVYSGSIYNCYNTGEISVNADYACVGGIMGFGDLTGRTANCYNTGVVRATSSNGNAFAGGIVGRIISSGSDRLPNMLNHFNTGEVSAVSNYSNAYAGGIVGNGSASNSYSTGQVKATAVNSAYAGGISGMGSATNCYYLNTSASNAVGNSGPLTNVLALTEAQMKQQASFVGFDFATVWAISPTINNGYPYLRGMQP